MIRSGLRAAGPLCGVAALLLGCGHPPAQAVRPAVDPYPHPASEAGFVRRVDAFPAFDSAGARLDFPFLGGLNNPRPQLVDIDGDGDLDLFVQEYTGRMMFFERTGPATARGIVFRTDDYQSLDVGEWSRFVDLDGDGDLDLLAESPYSYIRYFRNDGSATRPAFTPGRRHHPRHRRASPSSTIARTSRRWWTWTATGNWTC